MCNNVQNGNMFNGNGRCNLLMHHGESNDAGLAFVLTNNAQAPVALIANQLSHTESISPVKDTGPHSPKFLFFCGISLPEIHIRLI